MDITTDTVTIPFPLPTKKEIIQRLFTEEKITFDEMWVLLQDNDGTKYVYLPQPSIPAAPYQPLWPQNPGYPWYGSGTGLIGGVINTTTTKNNKNGID